MVFKLKLLNLLYDPDLWSWDFKVEFFPLQSDISIILLCVIVGVGPISRVLVVYEKASNVVMRCHLCWVPFFRGGIFEKTSTLFVTLCQWVP